MKESFATKIQSVIATETKLKAEEEFRQKHQQELIELR